MLEQKVHQLAWKLEQTKQWLHYRATVSSEEHRNAIDTTSKLAGDFAAFLEQPENLKELYLDRSLSKVASTIVEEVKSGNMTPKRTSPEVRYDGFPCVTMRYSNYKYEMTCPTEARDGTHVVLGLTYNLETRLPTKAYFFGFDNFFESFITHDVHFMFSPTTITEENIKKIITPSQLKERKITASENRVLIEWVRPRLEHSSTQLYLLFGQIECNTLNQPLFIYGHNSSTSKTFGMKIPENAADFSYATNE